MFTVPRVYFDNRFELSFTCQADTLKHTFSELLPYGKSTTFRNVKMLQIYRRHLPFVVQTEVYGKSTVNLKQISPTVFGSLRHISSLYSINDNICDREHTCLKATACSSSSISAGVRRMINDGLAHNNYIVDGLQLVSASSSLFLCHLITFVRSAALEII